MLLLFSPSPVAARLKRPAKPFAPFRPTQMMILLPSLAHLESRWSNLLWAGTLGLLWAGLLGTGPLGLGLLWAGLLRLALSEL